MPLVGESIIEITANFLETYLGLEDYLRENLLPKHALTYYFKLDPNNPEDRTYSIHATESLPKIPLPEDGWEGPKPQPVSWQLNRDTFDQHLKKMVAENPDIQRINGKVTALKSTGSSTPPVVIVSWGKNLV